GEEWIPSAPKHIALFDAFGWTPPIFVHCPVIVGSDGKKLSKRHGATRVLDYAAQGFMPQSLKNFIALIGWSPGEDREVLTEAELISLFDLDRLQPSPGRFDMEKLQWLSGHAIRALDIDDLLQRILDFVAFDYARDYHHWEVSDEDGGAAEQAKRIARWASLELLATKAAEDRDYVRKCVVLEQERVTTLADFGEACEFFLVDQPKMDAKAVEKWFGQPHARSLFEAIKTYCDNGGDNSVEAYEKLLRGFQESAGLEKLGPVVHPTRVALTGKTFGPGLFELMAVLGPERISKRLEHALANLS
ncbi:MAG: glutamate--tRNA ligase family protein, partial [Fimbriimonadaceae bacterium]